MDQVGFALPVIPGKTSDAAAFFEELESARKRDYAASEKRIGVDKEAWYIQHTPGGDLLVAYIESPNVAEALRRFSQSHDEFDQWFKRSLAEVTGVDLNNPPPWPLSDLVSSYSGE
jgi:hypothetical protein